LFNCIFAAYKLSLYIKIIKINIGMYISRKVKEDIFKKHGKSEKDTGSTEGQIALFTHRIQHLSEHLKQNRKDFNTERSLVRLVGKRRSLLDYLKSKDILRYREIVKELGLRK
jgi:small subunit ribosomal protein S15